MGKIESLVNDLRERALANKWPYRDEELLKIMKQIEGYENPAIHFIGRDPLLKGLTGKNCIFVLITGNDRSAIAFKKFDQDYKHYEILNFKRKSEDDSQTIEKYYSTSENNENKIVSEKPVQNYESIMGLLMGAINSRLDNADN